MSRTLETLHTEVPVHDPAQRQQAPNPRIRQRLHIAVQTLEPHSPRRTRPIPVAHEPQILRRSLNPPRTRPRLGKPHDNHSLPESRTGRSQRQAPPRVTIPGTASTGHDDQHQSSMHWAAVGRCSTQSSHVDNTWYAMSQTARATSNQSINDHPHDPPQPQPQPNDQCRQDPPNSTYHDHRPRTGHRRSPLGRSPPTTRLTWSELPR